MTLRQSTAAAGTIVFRTDAALQIGAGHVMRCLTLADALQAAGWQCHFVCRAHPGHLGALIEQRGHTLHLLPHMETPAINPATTGPAHAHWLGTDAATDAAQTAAILQPLHPDWLVVDHYALDACWETSMRPHCGHIMAIDDLADRQHGADLLLDQNLGSQEAMYRQQTPRQCRLLIGPQYALLRPEFKATRILSLRRRKETGFAIHQILISMGGVDANNITGKLLRLLARSDVLPASCQLTVVMGPTAPWLDDVKSAAISLGQKTTVLVGANNMAELMTTADLAIGASGSTAWERCCLGVPSIMLVLASNQAGIASALAAAGAALSLESGTESDMVESVPKVITDLRQNRDLLARISRRASEIVDGSGCDRVVAKLLTKFTP